MPGSEPAPLPLTYAEVDSSVLSANCRSIGRFVGSSVAVMAMVKSNGYGHGIRTAAQAAIAGGATWLGIAAAQEADDVADLGVPILQVTWTHPRHVPGLIAKDVHLTVFDAPSVEAIARVAETLGRRAKVHVKVDTGMHRLGATRESLGDVLSALKRHSRWIDVSGVYTHFADAEAKDPSFTLEQHETFLELLPRVRELAPDAIVHCANTGATLCDPRLHHDMVRMGISYYGYIPVNCPVVVDVHPALTLVATVMRVQTISSGETVGYGRTWTAEGSRRVATLSLGYGYGVSRALSNAGMVQVAGVRCPIAGRVSMDLMGVDVSGAGAVAPGDEVVIFGTRDGCTLGADEVARTAGMIPHELLTAVSMRIPRLQTALASG